MSAPRLFRGWWVMLAVCLANATLYVGACEGSLSVFFPTLLREFGWSRAKVSTIGTLHLMTPGLVAFAVGAACDRLGPRRLATVGIFAGTAGFLAAAGARSIASFYGFAVALALAESSVGFVPMQVLASRWFVRHRGLAMAIATAGISLGGMAGPVLTAALIGVHGWRAAFWVYGAACLLLAVPALFLLVRDRPEELGLAPDGAPPESSPKTAAEPGPAPGLPVGAAVRTPTFWAVTLTTAFLFSAVYAVSEHWVLLTTSQGMSVEGAARLLSFYYLMGVVGRFFWGPLFDRFAKKRVALAIVSGMAAMVGLLAFAHDRPYVPHLYALVFGFCYGGFLFLFPLLLGEYFGLRDLGKIIGASATVSAVLASLSPTLTGLLFDLTGSYRAPFLAMTVLAVLGVLLLTRVRNEWTRAAEGGLG